MSVDRWAVWLDCQKVDLKAVPSVEYWVYQKAELLAHSSAEKMANKLVVRMVVRWAAYWDDQLVAPMGFHSVVTMVGSKAERKDEQSVASKDWSEVVL